MKFVSPDSNSRDTVHGNIVGGEECNLHFVVFNNHIFQNPTCIRRICLSKPSSVQSLHSLDQLCISFRPCACSIVALSSPFSCFSSAMLNLVLSNSFDKILRCLAAFKRYQSHHLLLLYKSSHCHYITSTKRILR